MYTQPRITQTSAAIDPGARARWRRSAWAATLIMLLSSVACMRGKTTTHVPTRAVSPSTDKATLVFLRPWVDARTSKVPWMEQQNYVRVIQEDQRVMTDLRFNQYSVVRTEPGTRTFYAYNWAGGYRGPATCVGALRADLAPGRVYPVVIREFEKRAYGPHRYKRMGSHQRTCGRLELLKGSELRNFWTKMWNSERRQLSPDRERSFLVDGWWLVKDVVARGEQRTTGDAPWSASRSTMRALDGVRIVPAASGESAAGPGPVAQVDAGRNVGYAARPRVLPMFEFRLGTPYSAGYSFVDATPPTQSIGFRTGLAMGVTILNRLQLLLAIDVGGPQAQSGLREALRIDGRYGSGALSLGLEARFVSPPLLGLEWLGGVGVRGRVMGIDYNNPKATSPEPPRRKGNRQADTTLSYTGLGFGPILGARRTLIGTPGGSQLALIFTVQPEWTYWSQPDVFVRRDDLKARSVGAAFTDAARNRSLSWNINTGFEVAW